MGRKRTVPHVPGWAGCRCQECRLGRGEPGRRKVLADRGGGSGNKDDAAGGSDGGRGATAGVRVERPGGQQKVLRKKVDGGGAAVSSAVPRTGETADAGAGKAGPFDLSRAKGGTDGRVGDSTSVSGSQCRFDDNQGRVEPHTGSAVGNSRSAKK